MQIKCPGFLLYLGQNNTQNMNVAIENQTLDKIEKAKRGAIYFSDSFLSNENPYGKLC